MFFGLGDRLTEEQEVYLDAIADPQVQMVIVDAPAGTGKTTLAVAMAKLLAKPMHYFFAPVEEDKMGFRPGSQSKKDAEYLQPLRDALLTVGEKPMKAIAIEDDLTQMKHGDAWVHAKSHVFTRGINLSGCTVIIDETQNWTTSQLRKVLSRIHDDCKVIVIGHSGQCDLDDPSTSGFARLKEHFAPKEYVRVCQLTKCFRGRLAEDADKL